MKLLVKYVKKHTRYVPIKMLTATKILPEPGILVFLLRSEKIICLNTHFLANGFVKGRLQLFLCVRTIQNSLNEWFNE